MIILAADTERDQEMIHKFQRAYENLKKIVDKQNRKIDVLPLMLDSLCDMNQIIRGRR